MDLWKVYTKAEGRKARREEAREFIHLKGVSDNIYYDPDELT